jgi:hypothetical protein
LLLLLVGVSLLVIFVLFTTSGSSWASVFGVTSSSRANRQGHAESLIGSPDLSLPTDSFLYKLRLSKTSAQLEQALQDQLQAAPFSSPATLSAPASSPPHPSSSGAEYRSSASDDFGSFESNA